VFAAALQLCAVLAVPPLVQGATDGSQYTGDTERRWWAKGACAGDFLRSRFSSDVYPRLRVSLLAAAVDARTAVASSDPDSEPAQSTNRASLAPRQRFFVEAVRSIVVLCRPTVTVQREPLEQPSEKANDADGADQAVFGSGLHATQPYGSASASDTKSASTADLEWWRKKVRNLGPGGASASGAAPTRFTAEPSLLSAHAGELAALLYACRKACLHENNNKVCSNRFTIALHRAVEGALVSLSSVDSHAVAAARLRFEL
jgi:hypothetical protein